ncbi:efflux RND transporter permease subunit [Arcticibacter tournemirensis]|uniref:Efflux RND transporter permease subunit n=1 Tax=Arcticibacter tournemirensis TaxID=699437 RepID=A0A4Q0M7C8_9SPHI|nr:efflux RND transporter permease subunit [Arcticibacter tournemirensis]RXF68934.1 efflux RND transporter permease subunit [Arcticibacter tournemirensis]
MSITEIAIKRPLLLIVIFTVLILFGLQSYFNLNYNLLPRIDIPVVSVSTIYPGASAAEVQSSVTRKLEDAFASAEGLQQISSTSLQGVSQITIEFRSGVDVNNAEREIQRMADQALNDLPDIAERPQVHKLDLGEAPVIKAGISANLPPKQLYDMVDNQIRPILQNVPGVGQVDIIGGDKREIQVSIDREKLLLYGLSTRQVTDAVHNANQSFPAGSIETKNQQLSIRYDANLSSLDQLRNLIIVQNPAGGSIYLRDIAEVADATARTTAISHINGIPAIGIQIIKQADANAVDVSNLIKEAFKRIEEQYQQKAMAIRVSSDQSVYTLESADAVITDLMLAMFIVGLVMLAFLHSVRSSLFVLVALPSSIIPTFIAMYLLGFSLNLMTLMAMSLVVGILVDDSIVVLENIYRHLEAGSDKRKAALEGRNEIGFTALAITLVDVVVFLPLALAGGTIGAVLREFSLVVVFSTLMSLFVSFTITPMLASRFGKIEDLKKRTLWGRINRGFEHFIDMLKDEYGKLLARVLNRKRWLFAGTLFLLFGAISLLPMGFIGSAFIPTADQGELLINLELEPTASIYKTNKATQEAERIIMKEPIVKNVFSSIGFVEGSVAGTTNNANRAEITIKLTGKNERQMSSEEFGIIMQRKLTSMIPGVKFTTSVSSIEGGAEDAPIQIGVKGLDIEKVRQVAEAYQKLIATIPGTQFVKLSVTDRRTEVNVKLNRERMGILGLNASDVGATLQNSFSGNDQSLFKEAGNEHDILIILNRFNRSDINDVRRLPFTNSNGESFTLSQFAEVSESPGESALQRTDRMGSIAIEANVMGRPLGSVIDDIKARSQSIRLPEGISVEYLGDAKNQDEAFGSLGLALVTAFLLVYLIMVALYENAVYPFVVLFSIPVALVGALLALALTMETLNIFSIIGIIMLLGLVSKNAILIVDFTNQLKSEGFTVKGALVEAGRERLRPILMTTLAMIFGMLPIAMATGAGAEIKNGMAWVIIGGLTSSMILTLFVVPAMYLVVDNLLTTLLKKRLELDLQKGKDY